MDARLARLFGREPIMTAETVYRYCPECAKWQHMTVTHKVGYSAIRVLCPRCQRARVIADPQARTR